jgi:hypothetical protein
VPATATSPTRKLVLEFVTVSGGRLDASAGIIRAAKVLGTLSRNNRRYPTEVLARCHRLYESARVYVDHDYSGKTRPLGQLAGELRSVAYRADGIYADVHCLKETGAGRIVLEAADKMPDKFGLSPMHLIDVVKGSDGLETVREIVEVHSVDAVTNPATTKGLFEEEQPMPDEPAPAPAAPTAMSIEEAFGILVHAITMSSDVDDGDKGKAVSDAMKLKAKILGTSEEPEEPAEGEESSAEGEGVRAPGAVPLKAPAPRPQSLRATLGELAGQMVRQACRQMLFEAQIPAEPALLAQLMDLPHEEARAGYIAQLRRQRRRPYGSGAPRSAGRAVGEGYEGGALPRPDPKIPRLSKGASAEEVKRWLHSS